MSLGLQVKWNQFSWNNSHHTSCIHKGLHVGKWPDLMTSKPDSVSTLGCHWTDHTGRPLEPQVHLDATGVTLADVSTQWCCCGDPVLICNIGTHWKTTGATSTLGCHWNHTGWWDTQWCPSGYPVRKSKDYVYRIWVCKVLGIWKGYYRLKKITSFMHETVNRGKK